jgi:prepilin-type N-terminal cleavage/methylation domain-containing protein
LKIWIKIKPVKIDGSRFLPSRRQRAGFTLAEIMVSVAILAVMVVTVFSGFTLGWAVIRTSREDLRATQILTQKIESIRLLTWDELSLCPTSFAEVYNPSSQSTNGSGTVYNGSITIGPPTNIPNSVSYRDQVKLITVSVTWTSYGSGGVPVAHSRQMQTLSALNGMQNYIWGNHL